MPKVSIIIPFKSGEFFLTDCLESLKAQSFKDYEVLLVLDGYFGNISHVIDPYKKDMTIRVLSTDEGHQGVPAARNVGLENAEGEFVYFLDADDYIFEDAIQVLLEAAEETDEDMVYGKFHYTYYSLQNLHKVFLHPYPDHKQVVYSHPNRQHTSKVPWLFYPHFLYKYLLYLHLQHTCYLHQ